MGMKRSNADPCLYFKRIDNNLVIIVSWIDDNLIIGNKECLLRVKHDLMKQFQCDDCGELQEYVGCKIERKGNQLKFTQPVLLQSYNDEFKLPNRATQTPAIPGTVLKDRETGELLSAEMTTKYCSGIGKMMHMMQYSHPEVYNSVQDLSRQMKGPT
jgi:hypothetical protein